MALNFLPVHSSMQMTQTRGVVFGRMVVAGAGVRVGVVAAVGIEVRKWGRGRRACIRPTWGYVVGRARAVGGPRGRPRGRAELRA